MAYPARETGTKKWLNDKRENKIGGKKGEKNPRDIVDGGLSEPWSPR